MPARTMSLTQEVQFLRLSAGAYVANGDPQWGAFTFERPKDIEVAGVSMTGRSGRLTVRRSPLSESLTTADRILIDGDAFAITIKKAKVVDTEDLDLEVESAPSANLYAAEMDRRGSRVRLERAKPSTTPGPGSWYSTPGIRAIIEGFAPRELEGATGVDQGSRKVWLLAQDIAGATGTDPVPGAPIKNDRLFIRGTQTIIQSVDADTHRVGDVVNAYYCIVSGFQGK